MKTVRPPRAIALVATLAMSTLPMLAVAQASAPAPKPAASAPPAPRASSAPPVSNAASAPVTSSAGPRLLTPEQKRYRADETAAPDLVPERQVIPQVSLPLGTKSAQPKPVVTGSKKYPAPTVGGGIDDSAARCLAEASDAARAACMDKASGKSKSP